jgi:hypothetical protein
VEAFSIVDDRGLGLTEVERRGDVAPARDGWAPSRNHEVCFGPKKPIASAVLFWCVFLRIDWDRGTGFLPFHFVYIEDDRRILTCGAYPADFATCG